MNVGNKKFKKGIKSRINCSFAIQQIFCYHTLNIWWFRSTRAMHTFKWINPRKQSNWMKFSSSFLFITFSFSSLNNFTYLCIRSPNSGCRHEKKFPLLTFPSFSHHQSDWNDFNLNGIVFDVLNVLAYGVI